MEGPSTSASPSGRRRQSTRCTPSCVRSRRASGAGRRASASRWRPLCSSGCASWRPRRPSASRPPPRRPLPPPPRTVSVHVVDAYSRGARVRVRAVTEPIARVGARRRGRLDRCSRSRGRAAAGAGPDRGARRAPARTLRPARGPVPGAGAPGCPFRGDGRDWRRGVKVGVPTEIKPDEYRVALTPAGVRELREHGHEVLIQSGAGEGSAIDGRRIRRAGRAHGARRGRGLRRGRPRAEGEGAPARGGLAAAPGANPLHVPAPGGGRRADQRRCASRAPPASPTRPSRTRTDACRSSRR